MKTIDIIREYLYDLEHNKETNPTISKEDAEKIYEDLNRYKLILDRLYLTGIDNQIIYMIDIDGYSDEDRKDYFKLKDAVMDKLDEEFYREFFDPNTKNEDDE